MDSKRTIAPPSSQRSEDPVNLQILLICALIYNCHFLNFKHVVYYRAFIIGNLTVNFSFKPFKILNIKGY